MAEGSVSRLTGAALAGFLIVGVAACDGEDVADPPSAEEDEVFEHGLSGASGCEFIGSQALRQYLGDHQIEVADERAEEDSVYCSLSLIWAGDGEEANAWVTFGIQDYESVAQAELILANPDGVGLTSTDIRDQEYGLVESAPEPWEDGFIWSTPDSSAPGFAESAVRISNIVVWISFDLYDMLDPSAEECQGHPCVMPSDLADWIQGEYLPTVGADVVALMEE